MELASIQPVLDWVNAHQDWAQAVIFIVSAGESLALVGMIVPGVAFMLGVGALIGLGALDLYSALLWAALGAIAGDGISFWLGKRYHAQLKNLWPLSRYPDLIPQGEAFFRRHGGKSILFGRFFGPVRAIIPAVAGMMDMSPWRFYPINIFSALAWAPAVILPGVAFGASLSLAAEITARLAAVLLLLSLLAWLAFVLIRKSIRYFLPRSQAYLNAAHRWASNHHMVGPLVNAVIDPKHLQLTNVLTLWALSFLAFLTLLTTLLLHQQGILYIYSEMKPPAPALALSRDEWQTHAWQEAMVLNPEHTQTTVHGITLQWIDTEQGINDALKSTGWQPARKLSWQSALMMLNPDAGVSDLPVMPHVHNGYFPNLSWTKPHHDQNKIYIVRLWRSRFESTDKRTLWIGNVTISTINSRIPMLRFLTTSETVRWPHQALAGIRKNMANVALPPSGETGILLLD